MGNLKIGITHGDINGVGYETILKAFAEEEMLSCCTPIIYGSPKAATYHRKAIESNTNFTVISSAKDAVVNQLNLINLFGEAELKIDYGQPSEEAGAAAFKSLEAAINDLSNHKIDAVVTAPINKNTIQSDKFHFAGHTEYIENKAGDGKKALMILMNKNLKVALVTTHLPIAKVAENITKEKILQKLEILDLSLKRDFKIDNPRIAVLALNPHAGDGGLLGQEEQTIITPAVEEAFEKGIRCFGPYSADGFFGSGNYRHFDAILAMYHDQGLAPFKALAMDDGVNFTAGLPVVRTSPDHGTAYDIAGKNQASASSMREAIYAAIDICRTRATYDAAFANPLSKQYYEKRDDSYKLKLDQETEE